VSAVAAADRRRHELDGSVEEMKSGGPMTREEIDAFFARRQEAWKRRDLDMLMRDYSDDCIVDSPAGGKMKGRAAIEKVYREFFSSFPDLALDRPDYIIDKDRVAQTSTVTGTNKGGFMNLPPTGKRVSIPMVWIFRLKDGKIVEEQRVYDFTGMLLQAGVLKAKPL
jgi:steroid delta-isomerase-like uncharacterized protein